MNRVAALLALFLAAAAIAATAARAGDFALSQADSVQGTPALAGDTNTGRFLVIWTDNRSKPSGLDIYGRMVAADGALQSPEIPLTEAVRGQAFPALAFDPTGDRFLVVWTDWRNAPTVESDIYGRFVRTDGRPDGAAFPVAQERVSQKFPAVAFDPGGRRYLVVWIDRRHRPYETLYARFLGADGSFIGPDFRVADSVGDQRRPSVVLDPKRGRFLVLWWERQDLAIYARFVADPLVAGTPTITIADSNDPRPAANLAVASAPAEDRFFVVWTREGEADRHGLDVYGLLIDGAFGKAIGGSIPIATGTGREQSAVVGYDPQTRRFLVVWLERHRDTEAVDIRIHGRFVSVEGKLSDAFLLSDPETVGPRRSPALAFSPRSGSFLILWEDGRNGATPSRQIFGRTR